MLMLLPLLVKNNKKQRAKRERKKVDIYKRQ